MIPKLKKFIKKHKKVVIICLIALVVLIMLLMLYKSLFYSSKESDVYGVRLRDIKDNKITSEDISSMEKKLSETDGVESATINVKGRLIKFFVTFNDSATTDAMKIVFNDSLGYISDKVKNYYDITFYAEQKRDVKMTYPVIGYKHKNKTEISFDVF